MALERVGLRLSLSRNLRAAGFALGLGVVGLAAGGCQCSKTPIVKQGDAKTILVYDRELLPLIEDKNSLGRERCNGSEPLKELKLADTLKSGQTLSVTLARIVLEREQGDKFTSLPTVKQLVAINYLAGKIGSDNLLDKLSDKQKSEYADYCSSREAKWEKTVGQFPSQIDLKVSKDEIDNAMAAAGVVKASGQQPAAVAYKIIRPTAPVPVDLNVEKDITLVVSNNLLSAYPDKAKFGIEPVSNVGVTISEVKYCDQAAKCSPIDGTDVSNNTLVTLKVRPDSNAVPGTKTITLNYNDAPDKKQPIDKKDVIRVVGPSAPTASTTAKTPPTATATEKTPPPPTATEKTPPPPTATEKTPPPPKSGHCKEHPEDCL
ncbi:MAG: hypothetical protein PHG97_05190 [Candidatus Margulisbacteria bacterium]|nr:hypothetical protein [Candidatus Margulisiibacteriota bacterium]